LIPAAKGAPGKKKNPPGLARVRKEIPPPGKIFKSKKSDQRKRSKEELRNALKETAPRTSS
jgi:hypothetical protein